MEFMFVEAALRHGSRPALKHGSRMSCGLFFLGVFGVIRRPGGPSGPLPGHSLPLGETPWAPLKKQDCLRELVVCTVAHDNELDFEFVCD